MMKSVLAGGVMVGLCSVSPAFAEPTELVVHVISQDAKFVGDSMGGARVTLRDAKIGKVLARGLTKGSTGNTNLIMKSTGRSPQRATLDAAAFKAVLDLSQPTLITLEVDGPVSRPASTIKVSAQRWVMPGEAVSNGDGWTIELPGLAITPDVKTDGQMVLVSAKVEPMCGCPITPGGLWDSADYRVTASLWTKKRKVSDWDMAFATAPGGFRGQSEAAPGRYRLVIHALNKKTGNSGVVAVPVRLR